MADNSVENQVEGKKNGFKLGGGLLNYAFIAGDSALRMKDGESAPVAIGKALITNAAFSLLPGGIWGAMAVGTVMAAPDMINQMDRASAVLNKKQQQFGGNFKETETQVAMMQTGIGNMQNARTHAARKMANHARGAQRVY